jgi:hypothetical protein
VGAPPSGSDTTIRRTTPSASRLPGSLPFRSTCPPSPCGRLSRPRTTTGAPSPWGSRPTGDLALPWRCTSERGLGRPLIPTPDELRRYPTARACAPRCPKGTYAMASREVSLVTGLRMGRSGLDFKQSSLGPATRVLRDTGSLTSPFPASPACSGPPYLSVVSQPDDPGSSPESLLSAKGIQHQVARRTTASQPRVRRPLRTGLDGFPSSDSPVGDPSNRNDGQRRFGVSHVAYLPTHAIAPT